MDKTKVLLLHKKPSKISPAIRTKELKILGITISSHTYKSKLNFAQHVDNIVDKASKTSSMILSLCPIYSDLSSSKRITLYKTLIRPILCYGSNIWFQYLNQAQIKKLNQCQYRFLRFAIMGAKTISYQSAHIIANIPTIKDYI